MQKENRNRTRVSIAYALPLRTALHGGFGRTAQNQRHGSGAPVRMRVTVVHRLARVYTVCGDGPACLDMFLNWLVSYSNLRWRISRVSVEPPSEEASASVGRQ